MFTADLAKPGHSHSRGKIIVRADSVRDSNVEVEMSISASNLPVRTSCFCCNNNTPFFEIHRSQESDPSLFNKVFASEVANGTNNPIFKPFKIKGQQLCNSNKDLPIMFKLLN